MNQPARISVENVDEFAKTCVLLEKQFDEMKWIKNYKRKNVSKTPCYSMVFGEVCVRCHGLRKASNNKKYPKVYDTLQQLGSQLRLDNGDPFPFRSITINKNLPCLPHIDKYNKGNSVILTLGKFAGGKLGILQTEGPKSYDVWERPLMFDGSKLVHWTEPFEGTRYSVIFFNLKIRARDQVLAAPLIKKRKRNQNNKHVAISETHHGNLPGRKRVQVPKT